MCPAAVAGTATGAGVVFGGNVDADGVVAREELVEGGRDQPGPVVVDAAQQA